MKEPEVCVGILSESEMCFVFHGDYLWGNIRLTGKQKIEFVSGKMRWNGGLYDTLTFIPASDPSFFELYDVSIGINFHWERRENQSFQGTLKLIVENERITAINILPIEEYLISVISSEMSAHASLELLKAHAVISRSWLIAQIGRGHNDARAEKENSDLKVTEGELIRWYDRDDHTNFDVCADDHCQRYQGITRASTVTVRRAVSETAGQVLMYEGHICDARFSKCCGGALEEFPSCWGNVSYPYLKERRDSDTHTELPDLRKEVEADRWIRSYPEAFCHTTDEHILQQVLNNYDRETTDFYRWKVTYTQKELSELALKRSGIDYGMIQELIPLERGTSGRIVKLRIVGTRRSMVIGKELEIRRTLSSSHLYSSAFVVDKEGERFILTGAGWGHGVGLCQIGAAVMGERGYRYDEILLHYYTNAMIKKLYE